MEGVIEFFVGFAGFEESILRIGGIEGISEDHAEDFGFGTGTGSWEGDELVLG